MNWFTRWLKARSLEKSAAYSVAHAELHRQLSFIDDTNVYYCGYNIAPGTFEAQEAKIKELKNWAKANTTGFLRSSYLELLRVAKWGLNRARREMKTRKQEKEMWEYRQRREEENQAEREYRGRKDLPVPLLKR